MKQDNLPVVVLLNPSGQIVWTYAGLFGDDAYHELKSRLANPPGDHHATLGRSPAAELPP